MAAHNWHLVVSPQGRADLRLLSAKERKQVFASIKQLLEAENPFALIGVKKLVGKRFDSLWRQRSGDWRIIFALDSTRTTLLSHSYKGTIQIYRVLRRDEAYE